jgi:hypothetical protein
VSPEGRHLPLFFCFCTVHKLRAIVEGAVVQKARHWSRLFYASWRVGGLVAVIAVDPSEVRSESTEELYWALTLGEQDGSFHETMRTLLKGCWSLLFNVDLCVRADSDPVTDRRHTTGTPAKRVHPTCPRWNQSTLITTVAYTS